jgi:hypothetical protein
MLIAHAPAGYLLTRFLSRTLFKDTVEPQRQNRGYQLLMFAGIIGGIFPDFDFIYHIFLDSDRTPHHHYITHLPVSWLALLALLIFVGKLIKNRHFVAVSTVFCLSGLLHLVLDTLTGEVYWFAPFFHKGLNVFSVADVHVWWVRNYTDHWTFLFEIFISLAAMIVFLRVKETGADIFRIFRTTPKLRALSLRLAVCVLGLAAIYVVGNYEFNLNGHIVHKAKQLKHYIVRMAISS